MNHPEAIHNGEFSKFTAVNIPQGRNLQLFILLAVQGSVHTLTQKSPSFLIELASLKFL